MQAQISCVRLSGAQMSVLAKLREIPLSDAGTRTLRLTATTAGVLEAAGNESYNSWDWFEAVEPVGKPYV